MDEETVRPAASGQSSLWQTVLDAIAGACGAVCLVAAGAPFDTAKLRMQTGGVPRGAGVVGVMASLVRTEGLLSLWKGAGPALTSALVENVVVFGTNGALRRLVAGEAARSHDFGVGASAALGAASGVCSSIAICPAEVVKVKMQYQRRGPAISSGDSGDRGARRYASSLHCLVDVARAQGARGVFAGLGALMMRDVPFNCVFFGANALFRWGLARYSASPWARERGASLSCGTEAFLAGGFAGVVGWTAVFPFDTLKSVVQSGALPGGGAGGGRGASASSAAASRVPPAAAPPPPTLRAALGAVLRHGGGIRGGLYRGWSAAVLRAFPANAALFWGVHTAERALAGVGGGGGGGGDLGRTGTS